MAGVGKCCKGCITPPEIKLDGLEQTSSWLLLQGADCCWRTTFLFPAEAEQRWTGDVYSNYSNEMLARITYFSALGVFGTNSAGQTVCSNPVLRDIAFKEQWNMFSESWRKFSLFTPNRERVVYAQLLEVNESGTMVPYWYFRIEEVYQGTKGWEWKRGPTRSTALANADRSVVLDSCVYWIAGSNTPASSFGSALAGFDWTETDFHFFDGTSTAFGRIKVSDLEDLPPGDWWSEDISTEDPNLAPNTSCIPGIQDPLIVSYSINPPPPCYDVQIQTTNDPNTCAVNVIEDNGNNRVLLGGATLGFYPHFNFGLGINITLPGPNIGDCCTDDVCARQFNFPSPDTWTWKHRAEILTEVCVSEYNPYNQIFHVDFNLQARIP